MNEQGNTLAQTYETLEKSEILDRRKTAIMELIENMTDSLPIMAQNIVRMNLTTVRRYVEGLTYEQTEEIVEKAQSIIDSIR